MSILIKGLIMPHCCDVCTFSDWSNLHQTAVCKVNYYKPCFADHSNEFLKRRSDSCPLIEIPEPHGRLIDGDALQCKVDDIGLGYYEVLGVTEDTIDSAPTVIEAEGSEQNA